MRTLQSRSAIIWLSLISLCAACATNPVTGKRELSFMSPERERALGAQEAEKVAAQIGLVDDAELTAYVDSIGQRLVGNVHKRLVEGVAPPTEEYHFAVADMPEPNAFALPGGWIYVSRGLLSIANSEAEVANVVAHEIGHVVARHSAQRYTRQVVTGVGSVAATIGAAVLLGGDAGQTVGQLSQALGAGLIASYGRDQERQSDEVGQALAADTGYDPAAMAEFFRALEREEIRLTGTKRLPSWLDSHPVTSERIASSTERSSRLRVTPNPEVPKGPESFLAKLEGLLVGPNPAEGVFQDRRFLHPGFNFTMEFPEGWQLANQKVAVLGVAPNQEAIVALEGQPGTDPRAAAAEFAQKSGVTLQGGRELRIGGFDAYHAVAEASAQSGARIAVDLTWIAQPEVMFRITGQTLAENFRTFEPRFRATAESVRALTRTERASIKAKRIHLVRAKSGETLAALSRRTQNAWSVEETASANAISESARLTGGRLVKITREAPVE